MYCDKNVAVLIFNNTPAGVKWSTLQTQGSEPLIFSMSRVTLIFISIKVLLERSRR